MSTVTVNIVKVFAIIPVKCFNISKKRLSSVLNPEQRRALTAAMLEDVLGAVKASTVQQVLVISPDSAAREIADKFGFSYLSPKDTDLNPSLSEAIEWCMQKNANAVLILPADIPLVSSKDIDKLVEFGSEKSTIVLSPSINGGTNALLLNPPTVIPICFGSDSLFKHVREAIAKKVKIRFHSSRGLSLDIDSEEDLSKLLESKDVNGSKQVFGQLALRKKESK